MYSGVSCHDTKMPSPNNIKSIHITTFITNSKRY